MDRGGNMHVSRGTTTLRAMVVAVWVGFGLLLAGPAVALPGGDWASSGSPLTLTYRGQNTSAAYGSWQGYREDQGRGSRVQDWSAHRMPGVPGWPNTDGAYVRHAWYDNANRCYV